MGKIHKEKDRKKQRLCAMEKVIFSCENAKISVDKAKKVYYNNHRDESKWWGKSVRKHFPHQGPKPLDSTAPLAK